MNRREIIKGLALSFGYVVAAPSVLSVLESCSKKNDTWQGLFLSAKEKHFVTHIVDIILPATETPGGLDVNLPQFIDMMAHDMFSPDEKNMFKEGAEIFALRFNQRFNKDISESDRNEVEKLFASYFDLQDEDQRKVLYTQSKNIDEVSSEEIEAYKMYKFLINIRSLSLFGYFTSEKVGKEVLNFDPIPGKYVPCMPVSEIGNAWTI